MPKVTECCGRRPIEGTETLETYTGLFGLWGVRKEVGRCSQCKEMALLVEEGEDA